MSLELSYSMPVGRAKALSNIWLLFITSAIILIILPGCCSQEKAKDLKQKLYSSKVHERVEGASGLAYCGSKAESAVPRLAQLLYDSNPGVQSMAAYALRRIDTPAARAIMKRIDASRRRK